VVAVGPAMAGHSCSDWTTDASENGWHANAVTATEEYGNNHVSSCDDTHPRCPLCVEPP
jgi:hypothetical protein